LLAISLLAAAGAYAATRWWGSSPEAVARPTSTPEPAGTSDKTARGEPSAPRLPDPAQARVADAGQAIATVILDPNPPPGPRPEGMVWIPPGRFAMGSDYAPFRDARPIHTVTLDGFWMDATPVTNEQFARFVEQTAYRTVAERKPSVSDFPGVPDANLVPGSVVFQQPSGPVPLDDISAWWAYIPGASWRHPEGPNSSIVGLEKHPVVQVCWEDAQAYAHWAGKRLPTEAEWEYAARGGLSQQPYVWGNTFQPDGKTMANTWQGRFPDRNDREDGYLRTSPVATFPANGFGLYDMAGNVWQWCADWYRPDAYTTAAERNPQGPPDSLDPQEPGIPKRVQRGGSFLCCDQYCSRYMPGGRGKGAIDSGASHVGFRCVLTPPRK
jgi:formylglycine-generating enzyme required for sulfatase activity